MEDRYSGSRRLPSGPYKTFLETAFPEPLRYGNGLDEVKESVGNEVACRAGDGDAAA